MPFLPRFWCVCGLFVCFYTLMNSGEIKISVDNLLIGAFALNTAGVCGSLLVPSNCLVLLILFYWFLSHCVSQRQRRANSNHEKWMRCLINLWAFEYPEASTLRPRWDSPGSPAGGWGQSGGQSPLRLARSSPPSTPTWCPLPHSRDAHVSVNMKVL